MFSGSCTSLSCVGGQDDAELTACDMQNDLTVSVSGPTYIMVHGYGYAAGSFDLEVVCGMLCPRKSLCEYQAMSCGAIAAQRKV